MPTEKGVLPTALVANAVLTFIPGLTSVEFMAFISQENVAIDF